MHNFIIDYFLTFSRIKVDKLDRSVNQIIFEESGLVKIID